MVTLGQRAAPPAWLAPTVRACRPSLLAVGAVVAVYTAAAIVAGAIEVALPMVLVWLALGALAGAAAASPDPAATLLAALPVSSGRRLVHRVGIGTLTAVIGWAVAGRGVDAAVSVTSGIGLADSVPALLALLAVAVAVGSRFGTWGALTPLALVAVGHLVERPSLLTDALALWRTHPWIVVVGAVGVTVTHHRTRW